MRKRTSKSVGEAENEKAALALALETKPDIALVDMSLETSSGLDTAKQLLRSSPNTHIVLFAGSNNEKLLFEAIRSAYTATCKKRCPLTIYEGLCVQYSCGERVLGESGAVTQVVIEFHRLAKEQERLNRGLSQGRNRYIATRIEWIYQ